ncbi:MAG: GGDEF domain-containing protein [Thalassotalea sp.]
MKKEATPSKERWQNNANFDSINDADKKRRVFSFIAMVFIAIIVFSSLIYSNYEIYPPLLTATLALALAGLVTALLLFYKTKDLAKTTIIVSITILLLTALLTYTGGKDNTALYWLMFSPLAAFAIFGVYTGSVLTVGLIASILFLLYGPDIGQAVYGNVEKSRFFASYCVVIIFAFINEYFRNQSFETISLISKEQKKKANTDPLTGLANRRFIDALLLPQLNSDQNNTFPLSLIMVDIDDFKQVNDTHGHDVGDAAIIHIAQLLKNQVRNSDVVSRYGGEEFLIFLPQTPHQVTVTIAEKIRQRIEETPFIIEQKPTTLTCSFGVYEVDDAYSFEQAIKNADKNLYQAKKLGKNRVVG